MEMNDEKISLRIDSEQLEQIDAYLSEHPEEGSRSLFIKNAVREKIQRDAGSPAGASGALNGTTVSVSLPMRLIAAVEALVSEGYYMDVPEALRAMIRRQVPNMEAAEGAVSSAASQRATQNAM